MGFEIDPKWGRKKKSKSDRKRKGKTSVYKGQHGVLDGVMLGQKSKKIGVKKYDGKKKRKKRGSRVWQSKVPGVGGPP